MIIWSIETKVTSVISKFLRPSDIFPPLINNDITQTRLSNSEKTRKLHPGFKELCVATHFS